MLNIKKDTIDISLDELVETKTLTQDNLPEPFVMKSKDGKVLFSVATLGTDPVEIEPNGSKVLGELTASSAWDSSKKEVKITLSGTMSILKPAIFTTKYDTFDDQIKIEAKNVELKSSESSIIKVGTDSEIRFLNQDIVESKNSGYSKNVVVEKGGLQVKIGGLEVSGDSKLNGDLSVKENIITCKELKVTSRVYIEEA